MFYVIIFNLARHPNAGKQCYVIRACGYLPQSMQHAHSVKLRDTQNSIYIELYILLSKTHGDLEYLHRAYAATLTRTWLEDLEIVCQTMMYLLFYVDHRCFVFSLSSQL